MKNIRFFTIGLLLLVTLAACSPANSAQQAKTASSSRKPIKQSSTKKSSSKPSSTSSDSTSSNDFSDRYSMDPDDMVAAFGQPVSSTDSANPGDGVNVWVTDNGDIMAFFRNNVLTDITFRLRGGDANHQSTGSISKSDTPKTALERLGKPYAIMRSERWTSYVYKDSNGDESSFSTQGNKIFNVTSAAETKQLKKITGLDKNQ